MIYTLPESHELVSKKLWVRTRKTMFSRYQSYEFFSLTHIPHYFNGISHNSAGWFLAVSENSRNFAPVIPEKRKRRAQRRRWRKRKRAYSCLNTTICPLSGNKPEKKLQAIGSMQCTNDYCTILKRIRNEWACSSQFVPSKTNLPIWAVERTCLPMHGQTS